MTQALLEGIAPRSAEVLGAMCALLPLQVPASARLLAGAGAECA